MDVKSENEGMPKIEMIDRSMKSMNGLTILEINKTKEQLSKLSNKLQVSVEREEILSHKINDLEKQNSKTQSSLEKARETIAQLETKVYFLPIFFITYLY